MSFEGGTRRRLIKDSLALLLDNSLASLGWYEKNKWFTPVTFIDEPISSSEKVPVNTVSLSFEDDFSEEAELGSNMERVEWEFFVDIYAEDSSVGTHLSGDIRDLLKGKMSGLNRTKSTLEVLDLTQDPSPSAFYCDLEGIESAKVRASEQQHRRDYYTVGGYVVDYN